MTRTPEEIKAHAADYRKMRKNSFKERGICPNCEKRPSAVGKVCCIQCLEDKKLTQKFGTAGPYRQIYGDLFERQQGLCGICQKPMAKPVLDYSHETMEVRGLLCSRCNIGLRQFQDDPVILASALRYINTNAGIGITMKKRKNP